MRHHLRTVLFAAAIQFIAATAILGFASVASADPQEGAASAMSESLETKADHEQAAAMYEEEANMLRGKLAQHERMAKLYEHSKHRAGKRRGASMMNHCNNIITSYKAAIVDNSELAKHHRAMAADAEQ
jgi:hypothetical protein